MTALAPGDFWVASGHHFCERGADGRLAATPDLWRLFLARPELRPPPEACGAERLLHARLMEDPLAAAAPDAIADPDARENWALFLGFRDRVAAHATLEAAWVALFRAGVAGIPPIFLQMLTQLVARAAMEGEGDAFALRAAELFFRPQRVSITQGMTLLADEEVLEREARAGDFGALGRLLEEAGAAPAAVEFDVLSAALAPHYRMRSDAHDLALDLAEGGAGRQGLARALERLVLHLFGAAANIASVPVIEDRNWSWHVGLDAEASRIANALWKGAKVPQAELSRILWLGVLRFAEDTPVLARMRGRPVYLALAMDAEKRVRMKPQNLVAGLPLLVAEAVS